MKPEGWERVFFFLFFFSPSQLKQTKIKWQEAAGAEGWARGWRAAVCG